MDNHIDNLRIFLDQIKSIRFFDRIFRWKRIKESFIEAYADYQKLLFNASLQHDKIAELRSSILVLEKDEERKNQLEIELEGLYRDYANLEKERNFLKNQNIQLLTEEDMRKNKFDSDVANIRSIREKIEGDRLAEIEFNQQKETARLEALARKWINHQEEVKQTIKTICAKHTIDYVDKPSFKGEPDNVLKICDEYIVFDAKSPRGEDLNNFPIYLQKQTEEAKKYAKQDGVKRLLFFVIPSNTHAVLEKFVYNLADYDVFIVTLDSVEPVIMSLKKIEEYEMAEQLSPEDRENICRILGKFAHLAKRRIQVDYYFIKQFLELSYKAEADLPVDILDAVKEFEKFEKLNPPVERRTKAISIIDLEKDATRIKNEAGNQGIAIQEELLTEQINKLPLYQDKN
jgi:hypothetical protein